MREYLKKEPFPAHLFSVAVSDNPKLKYVFAKTHYGEDALGYYCPTDKGLRALVKDAMTQALDASLPLIVLVAKRGARMSPAETALQDKLTEYVREISTNIVFPEFRSHELSDGSRTWGIYEDSPSPNMPVNPPLVATGVGKREVGAFPFSDVWKDVGGWSCDPDDDFARKSAETFTETSLDTLSFVWRIVCFGAWASRASSVRKLLPPSFLAQTPY